MLVTCRTPERRSTSYREVPRFQHNMQNGGVLAAESTRSLAGKAHRHLIRLLALRGRRRADVAQVEVCCSLLTEKLCAVRAAVAKRCARR